MIEGNFYHNFLGWDYAIWVSGGLFVLWLYINSKLIKNKKLSSKRAVMSMILGVSIALHFIFIAFINPYFFGYGSPVAIDELYLTGHHICLFDTKKDIMTPQDDFDEGERNIHTRIHLVDRNMHELVHTENLGTNFTFCQLGQEIVFIENSANPQEERYYVKSVSIFDLETKKRELIAKQSGFISAEGKSIKVFKISIDESIKIQNKQADVYVYDQEMKKFRSPDSVLFEELKGEVNNFRFQMDENANQVSHLSYKHKDLEQEFIYPKIENEFTIDNVTYCLVRSYEDLTKQQEEIAVISESGELKWKKSVLEFEHTIDVTLSSFDLIKQDRGKLYLTSGSYLIECDALKGTLNWWIKL